MLQCRSEDVIFRIARPVLAQACRRTDVARYALFKLAALSSRKFTLLNCPHTRLRRVILGGDLARSANGVGGQGDGYDIIGRLGGAAIVLGMKLDSHGFRVHDDARR
jgi:hypothetical protein